VIRHVFYLHGFASSPQSSKASAIAGRLGDFGVTLHRPDFNDPEFYSLTVTRMILQLEAAIHELPPAPVTLIGSSLGGFVAWIASAHAARQRGNPRPIDRLLLLAPALDFGPTPLDHLTPEELEEWRRTRVLDVHHYGTDDFEPLDYAFYEDAQRYDAFALQSPAETVIVYGRRDELVSPEMIERFAEGRPNVSLHPVDDDHQLHGSLDLIWRLTSRLVGLPAS
jgi:pimeloyl-ACP methyl ester carboxylesterase